MASLNPMFEVALIETRNTCTRTCVFCKFGQERQDEGISIIEDEVINKIAVELGNLNYDGRISPFGINEPLIEPRNFDIIALFRQHCPNAPITIASNGDCLNRKVYDRLFESGLTYLFVDAYDDQVLEKVTKLVAPDKATINDMRQPNWRHLDNRGGSIQGDTVRIKRRQERDCLRPSSMLFIRPPGHVVLCCSDMYSDVVMGDIQQNTISEIWLNQKFQHYRHTLATEGRSNLDLCKSCSYLGHGARREWSTPSFEPMSLKQSEMPPVFEQFPT